MTKTFRKKTFRKIKKNRTTKNRKMRGGVKRNPDATGTGTVTVTGSIGYNPRDKLSLSKVTGRVGDIDTVWPYDNNNMSNEAPIRKRPIAIHAHPPSTPRNKEP
jgi:hypothetical protein